MEVVYEAVSHGLAPLLYRRLKESDARADVPPDAWERLRSQYFERACWNVRLYRELRTLLRRLRSDGIPVIVLKGAYLAEAVYGDIALRPILDADLLVPRAELPRALAVLLDMGGVHQQSEDIESCCKRGPHLPRVVMRYLMIEIHWTIASPTGPVRVDAAGLWDRVHPASVAGVEVLALSPEDLLLHLCLHICYQHRLRVGLKSICDIAQTIHRFRDEMDWTEVADRAREWGAARYVGLTLHLARSMLGSGVPDDVLERLVPGGLDQVMIETARESVLTQSGYGRWMPFFDQMDAKSIGDKARLFQLFRKRVFLSRGEMAAKYPASRNSRRLYFYHALRLRDAVRFLVAHTQRRRLPLIRSRGRDRKVSLVNWLKSGQP